MRGIWNLAIVLAVISSARSAVAQQACDAPYRPPHVRQHHRPLHYAHAPCPCPTCSRPPCDEPPSPAEVQGAPGPVGVYAVGPQSGEMVGASSAMGIRGAEITMPALRLTLPSIRFPSLFRSRQNAFMQVNSSVAPLTQQMPTVAVPPAQVMAFPNAGAGVAGAQGEENKDAGAQDLSAQEKRIDEKLKELQRCLKRLEALQYGPPPVPPCGHAPGRCDCAYRDVNDAGGAYVEPRRMAHSSRGGDPYPATAMPDSNGLIRQLAHQGEVLDMVERTEYEPATFPVAPRGRIIDVRPLRRLPDTCTPR